jgi:GntR family transcriptional regulator, transcriptional repressor for pyruvate dehydrogenase complex
MTDINIQSDYISTVIKGITAQIIEGDLKTGDKVESQRDLCIRYNVGTGVVRESLQVLRAMKIIKTITGKGSFVSDININSLLNPLEIKLNFNKDTFINLYEFRSIIELWAIEKAVKSLNKERVKYLETLLENMKTYLKLNHELYILEDLKLHEAIVRFTDNEVIEIFYSFLRKLLIDYMKISGTGKEFLKRGFGEHLELIKALKNRDIEKARECLKLHLDNSVKVLSMHFRDS